MQLTQELDNMVASDNRRRDAANHLQCDWGACRLSFEGWPGTNAAVRKDKKQVMAEAVGAKKIGATVPKFDTKHPAYKALTELKGKIADAWKAVTLDWVEDGVRLIRVASVSEFNRQMADLHDQLDDARDEFARVYADLIEQAQIDNGDLFDRSKYLASFEGAYTFTLDFPPLTPPEWLQGINPGLYAEQSARVAARFDAAVTLAEDAFVTKLAELVETLQRKLSGLDDGTEKRLHETAIGNLREFFERFRSLNLHSSEQLDRVVEQAEAALAGGINKDDLRDSAALREEVRNRLSQVSASLDGLMVGMPRRKLNRRTQEEPTDEPAAE